MEWPYSSAFMQESEDEYVRITMNLMPEAKKQARKNKKPPTLRWTAFLQQRLTAPAGETN